MVFVQYLSVLLILLAPLEVMHIPCLRLLLVYMKDVKNIKLVFLMGRMQFSVIELWGMETLVGLW